jgi:hypothetical protein
MKNIVRNFFVATAVVAAIAFTSTVAHADSNVKIPFEFKVGTRTLPAGDYVIKQSPNHSMVQLISRDGKQSFTWVLRPGDPDPNSTAVKLTFDVNGTTDWLHSIDYGAATTPVIDPGSSRFEYSRLTIVGR